MEILEIQNKKRKIEIEVVRTGFFRKAFGLMFRRKDTNSLLFEFRREGIYSLTALFVFFDFLVVWLDETNKVLETKIVKPFILDIRPKKKFKRIIEIPINKKNLKIIRFFVGKRNI